MPLEALRPWNPHWFGAPVTERVLKDPRSRAAVPHWVDEVLRPPEGRWAVKPGPRQVGKTTSLGHVARTLMEEHDVAPRRIVIASLDDEAVQDAAEARIEDLIQAAFDLHAPTSARPSFLLLDEIQAFPDWAAQLKAAWDRHHPVLRVLATGSSAPRLIRPIAADFHGRIRTVTVHPMKFREVVEAHPTLDEHVDVSGIGRITDAARAARSSIVQGHEAFGEALHSLHGVISAFGAAPILRSVWHEYCAWGGYPAIRAGSRRSASARLDIMEGALNTVLARDVAPAGVRKLREFRILFRHIAQDPGGKFEPYGIGKDLGVEGNAIREWKQILDDVMVVQQLGPLKPDLTEVKGNDKAYVNDPAWISFFRGYTGEDVASDDPLIGLIVETVLVDHLRRLRFNVQGTTALPLGYVSRPEIDLAIDLGPRWLLMESKYSDHPRVRLQGVGPTDAVRVVATRDRFETASEGEAHWAPAYELALLC